MGNHLLKFIKNIDLPNFSLLIIFKYTTIIHIFCVLFNVMFYRYLNLDGYIDEILYYTDYAATLASIIIMTIKIMQRFTKKNKFAHQKHSIINMILEYTVAFICLVIIFLNKSLSKNFIGYLATLSKEAHNDDIIFILFLLTLYFLYYLYDVYKKKITAQSLNNLQTIIFSHTLQLVLKITIIMGFFIQSINPLLYIFEKSEMIEFQNIIFRFTSTTFLFYIHTTAIILLAIFIVQLIYMYHKNNNLEL
jgi:hypothetical protein